MSNNYAKGCVALKVAGDAAYVQFTVDALEALEIAFRPDRADDERPWFERMNSSLAKMEVASYRKVLAATLKDGDVGQMPFGTTYETLNIAILDAFHLAVHGRTYDEQKAWNDEQMKKRLEGLQDHPQLAAILSLLSAGNSEPAQG